ncbi:MAG: hypothetical protein JWP35_3538 [Caulobacter sp.]|nr:hypothetical protein [Caulobacter sp.]
MPFLRVSASRSPYRRGGLVFDQARQWVMVDMVAFTVLALCAIVADPVLTIEGGEAEKGPWALLPPEFRAQLTEATQAITTAPGFNPEQLVVGADFADQLLDFLTGAAASDPALADDLALRLGEAVARAAELEAQVRDALDAAAAAQRRAADAEAKAAALAAEVTSLTAERTGLAAKLAAAKAAKAPDKAKAKSETKDPAQTGS